MQKVILALFLLFILASCTSKRVTDSNQHTAELGAGLSFSLLHPASYGQPLSLTQVAEISTDKGQHELIFVLQIQANEMTVIGLLPNGTRVFTIVYDGNQLKSEGYNELIEKLDPKYLIADIQISLWPLKTLEQHWLSQQDCFAQRQCVITEDVQALNGARVRAISMADKRIITVEFSSTGSKPETMVLNHLERGYQITLESTN